jgi:hypothetical protein
VNVDVERLLWRLVDKYAPALPAHSGTVRPQWFDRAGDLVVGDGRVSWETPWCTEGGFTHGLPVGSHPVYVGTYAYTPDDWNPDAFRYATSMIVIPLAEPARIEAAKWDVDGYGDVHLIEDYAVLWGEEAMRATLPFGDDLVPHFVHGARDDIVAKGPHHRRANWVEAVLDRETGANAFVFPVGAENVTGYEIVDGDENLLCLVLVTYD